MRKTHMIQIKYIIPHWVAQAIRPLIRHDSERDCFIAHLAITTEDALERPRTLLAEFKALYGRYATQGPKVRLRLRIPQDLATRLASAEASGIRQWIILAVAASRAATRHPTEERTAETKLRPGGDFEVD